MDRSKDIRITLSANGEGSLADLFRKAMLMGKVLGINYLPNDSYIFTFFEREVMLAFAEDLSVKENDYEVSAFKVEEPENVFVRFKGVHPSIPDDEFEQHVTDRYMKPVSSKTIINNELKVRTDVRIVEFDRIRFTERPIATSSVDIGGDVVTVKFKNQTQTCRICDAEGHMQADCPVLEAQTRKKPVGKAYKSTESRTTVRVENSVAQSGAVNVNSIPKPVLPADNNLDNDVASSSKSSTPTDAAKYRSSISVAAKPPVDDESDWFTLSESIIDSGMTPTRNLKRCDRGSDTSTEERNVKKPNL